MSISIYAIRNPETKEVLYVGASINPEIRYGSHRYGLEWGVSTYKARIVRELRAKGKYVEMDILEVCETKESARERESYWIAFYKNEGHNLQQRTNGGYPILEPGWWAKERDRVEAACNEVYSIDAAKDYR